MTVVARIKDTFTFPVTVLTVLSSSPTEGHNSDIIIHVSHVLPTRGWSEALNSKCEDVTINLCIFHAFGKCFGIGGHNGPESCKHAHVSINVLSQLRHRCNPNGCLYGPLQAMQFAASGERYSTAVFSGWYILGRNRSLFRTVKANFGPRLRQLVNESLVGTHRPPPQVIAGSSDRAIPNRMRMNQSTEPRQGLCYLEFPVDSVLPTLGFEKYTCTFHECLLESTDPHILQTISRSFSLCDEYCLHDECPKGRSCNNIHANLRSSLTKDVRIRNALESLSSSNSRGNSGLVSYSDVSSHSTASATLSPQGLIPALSPFSQPAHIYQHPNINNNNLPMQWPIYVQQEAPLLGPTLDRVHPSISPQPVQSTVFQPIQYVLLPQTQQPQYGWSPLQSPPLQNTSSSSASFR